MTLPFGPPLSPMLAKLSRDLPVGDHWSYEPKWDGFRCIVFRDGDEVELGSRNERPLTRYFPELIAPLRAALPKRAVVDGEIVIMTDHGLDFDLLSNRIHPAESRITNTQVGLIKGKLNFMAPEQIRGQALDRRVVAFERDRHFGESVVGIAGQVHDGGFERVRHARVRAVGGGGGFAVAAAVLRSVSSPVRGRRGRRRGDRRGADGRQRPGHDDPGRGDAKNPGHGQEQDFPHPFDDRFFAYQRHDDPPGATVLN